MSHDWRDENRLRELYVEREMSGQEVADELGCSRRTIFKWLEKHDIPKRRMGAPKDRSNPWNDRETLHREYWENDKSAQELAEQWDVHRVTITNWLDKLDIQPKEDVIVPFGMFHESSTSQAYERWRHQHDGDVSIVLLHRLLSVAEFGFEDVCEHDIHHIDEVPWNNQPSNIELITTEEHTRLHNSN